MRFENTYSIHGLALAFSKLDQTNTVIIEKEHGSGWDELLEAITDLLKGMKCDFRVNDEENQVTVTVAE